MLTDERVSTSIREAKQKLTISALWPMLGLQGKAAKSCRSPFREDSEPSFSVFIDDDGAERWKDHATGETGDAVDFLAKARGLTDGSNAIREFLTLAGCQTPTPNTATSYHCTGDTKASHNVQESRQRVGRISPHNFSIGTPADFHRLSILRSVSVKGLRLASEGGVLRFCNDKDGRRCFVVTDSSCRLAQLRRLDGEPFPAVVGLAKRKAHTWHGSEAAWPINCESLTSFNGVALVEGGPDILAGFGCAVAEGKQTNVAIVGMLGASCSISDDALPFFAGKHVRLFPHADEAGQQAGLKWWNQLASVDGVTLDWFEFDATWTQEGTGEPVKDLNDLCRLSYDDFESDRSAWEVL